MLHLMKYDRRRCPDPLLYWDYWCSYHSRPENFSCLCPPPIKTSSAPKMSKEQVEKEIEEEEKRKELPMYEEFKLLQGRRVAGNLRRG